MFIIFVTLRCFGPSFLQIQFHLFFFCFAWNSNGPNVRSSVIAPEVPKISPLLQTIYLCSSENFLVVYIWGHGSFFHHLYGDSDPTLGHCWSGLLLFFSFKFLTWYFLLSIFFCQTIFLFFIFKRFLNSLLDFCYSSFKILV